MGDGFGFGLNFLIILFGSVHEDEASLCTFESLRKDRMSVGYNDIGDGDINSNEESGNKIHGLDFQQLK